MQCKKYIFRDTVEKIKMHRFGLAEFCTFLIFFPETSHAECKINESDAESIHVIYELQILHSLNF